MIQTKIKELLKTAYEQVFDLEIELGTIQVERPNDNSHGDFSSNIILANSKNLETSNPREAAEKLVAAIDISEIDNVENIELAGPGFINFYVSEGYYLENLKEVLSQGSEYGKSEYGEGKRVMIEFGQPNTHKAFHIGHLRSAISGLGLVRLYENLGYEVISANFFGDIGMHVAKCTWGYIDLGRKELTDMDIHERMEYIDNCYVHGSKQYKDDEVAQAAIKQVNTDIYQKEGDNYEVYKKLREYSLEHQNDIWNSLGVSFDREYPETEVIEESLDIVNSQKGELFEEDEGAVIFRGDDHGLNNWVFITSEGHPTYEAKDLGLAVKKFNEYDPDLSIITTSVEQNDHFKAVIYCLEQYQDRFKDRYLHMPFGWLLRKGRKFSSRMGESVKGMDIIREVQSAAYDKVSETQDYTDEEKQEIASTVADAGLKFLILSHEFHKDFSYDLDQFLSFDGFSGPYLLYSYARGRSILRKAEVEFDVKSVSIESLEEVESDLIRKLESYPEIAEAAARLNSPHLIATYVYELAKLFNSFYNSASILDAPTEAITKQRLAITAAVTIVLKNGLNLLGIEAIEKM